MIQRQDHLWSALVVVVAMVLAATIVLMVRPAKIQRVEVPGKGPVEIVRMPNRVRATLDQVRKDWGIEGRLVCQAGPQR